MGNKLCDSGGEWSPRPVDDESNALTLVPGHYSQLLAKVCKRLGLGLG